VDGLKKGTYYSWKVVSEDENGAQCESDECLFLTRIPLPPVVNGSFNGKPKTEYAFSAFPGDQDGEQYYWLFDWGDEESSGWLGPYDPHDTITVNHTWKKRNTYAMKVRYKEDGLMSEWAEYEVSMPFISNSFDQVILKVLERFPFLSSLFLS
jgi:hypothetical protein